MLRGAEVTLISGKVNIAPVPFVNMVNIVSAKDMYYEVMKASEYSDINNKGCRSGRLSSCNCK